jgi:hypothetical protein
VEAGKIGEVLVSKLHVVRSTCSLIFITTEVTVDKRYRDGERRVQDIEERELRPRFLSRPALAGEAADRTNGRTHLMQYRNLGRSGLKISPICLGTMMFGGPTDEATSARIVAKAREAGINFIDLCGRL